MKIFYSPSTKGFYPSTIFQKPPKDSVEIPIKDYYELLKGEIVTGSNGKPIRKEKELVN